MGLLDALILGAASGAGEAVKQSSLEQQRADLDVEKQNRINENKLTLEDKARQAHANEFGNALNESANNRKSDFIKSVLHQYDTADRDENGQIIGSHSLHPDELHPEDRAKYDAITPYSKDVVREAGMKTGFMSPEEIAKLDMSEEKMNQLNQYWQGKLEAAKDSNDVKLTIANMRSAMAGESKTALAASVSLVDTRIKVAERDLSDANKAKEEFLKNLSNRSLKNQINPNTNRSLYDERLSELDGNIDSAQRAKSANEIMSDTVLSNLGISSPRKVKPSSAEGGKPSVSGNDNLRSQAEAAIANGKDPDAVKAKYKELTGKEFK